MSRCYQIVSDNRMGVLKEKACHIGFVLCHKLLSFSIVFGKDIGKFEAVLLADFAKQFRDNTVVSAVIGAKTVKGMEVAGNNHGYCTFFPNIFRFLFGEYQVVRIGGPKILIVKLV